VQTTGATASVAFGANADAAIHGVGTVPKTGSAHKGVG